MEGLGTHRLWGVSPAVDLVHALVENRGVSMFQISSDDPSGDPSDDPSNDAVNLLVVGSGDVRHALATIASLRRWLDELDASPKKKVNIFLYDSPVECLARHLILLAIACDWAKPVRQRAHLFLEVFGNALVQERTAAYIAELGAQLVKFVCDGVGPLKRLVDLSHLKFKETDALEQVFKSWSTNIPFDMKAFREERLRTLLQQRYDARDRLSDWAFQEGVKPQAPIVHITMFKHWRETGVAFEFGDATYTVGNRSMASYAEGKQNGISKLKRGFWSDVTVSPYFCFGVDCEQPNQHARDLFKVLNKGLATEQQRHNTVHIAVYNLLAYLSEIENNHQYLMREAHDIYSGLDLKTANAASAKVENHTASDSSTAGSQDDEDKKAFAAEAAQNIMDLNDRVKIVLMTGDILMKSKFKNKFDLVWLSNHNAHLINDSGIQNCINYASKKPVVLVETARNMVMLKPDIKQQYLDKINLLCKAQGWVRVEPKDKTPDKDLEYLSFIAAEKKKQN